MRSVPAFILLLVLGGCATEGVTRPVLRSSPNGKPVPDYTVEARKARASGVMVVKCVLTAEGRATACEVIKPITHMEQAVLSWLEGSQFTPATFQGKPVQVNYVFNVRLSIPEEPTRSDSAPKL